MQTPPETFSSLSSTPIVTTLFDHKYSCYGTFERQNDCSKPVCMDAFESNNVDIVSSSVCEEPKMPFTRLPKKHIHDSACQTNTYLTSNTTRKNKLCKKLHAHIVSTCRTKTKLANMKMRYTKRLTLLILNL
jgi:hypothetical protein